jgi:hypothetical protein
MIEMQNFGSVGVYAPYTTDELRQYLNTYSARNARIKKAQFHVAFSCKGKEKSIEELLDFAHAYLKEMGYADPGQPLLVYAHTDTPNNHIHVITSRVAPDGRKINDHNERIRSQAVINKLLGIDTGQKTLDDIENSKGYRFSSVQQYRAILSSLGYDSFEKDDRLNVVRDGAVQAEVQLSEIRALLQMQQRDCKRELQLKAILQKYRDITSSKEELAAELKCKFGLDLIFFGQKDSPYGYTLVDHHNRCVHAGSDILKIKELLDFTTPQEKLKRANDFIRHLLDANPRLTTKDLMKKLRSSHVTIKNGILYYGKSDSKPLDRSIIDALRRNDSNALRVQLQRVFPEEERARLIRKPTISSEKVKRGQNREWEVGHKDNANDVDENIQDMKY